MTCITSHRDLQRRRAAKCTETYCWSLEPNSSLTSSGGSIRCGGRILCDELLNVKFALTTLLTDGRIPRRETEQHELRCEKENSYLIVHIADFAENSPLSPPLQVEYDNYKWTSKSEGSEFSLPDHECRQLTTYNQHIHLGRDHPTHTCHSSK